MVVTSETTITKILRTWRFILLPRHYNCVKRPLEKECAGLWRREAVAKSDRSRMVDVLPKTTKEGDQHMSTYRKFVGLGVHKDTIVVAVAYAGREGADPKSAGLDS